MAKVTPPFSWLGRFTTLAALGFLLLLAVMFRFWRLGTLPPGLSSPEAAVGLQALALLHHGTVPHFDSANSFAPLWVVLQAGAVALFGHAEWVLRLWPATLGVLAVVATWLWARAWFGARIGWLAGFVMAVTPWSVTMSRNGLPAILAPLLVATAAWCATGVYRTGRLRWWGGLGLVMAASALCGPLGWLLIVFTMGAGLVIARRQRSLLAGRGTMIAGALSAAGLAVAGVLAGLSVPTLRQLPDAVGLSTHLGAVATAFGRTLAMFNVVGDDSFRHNLGGEPLLNAFIGLMFVAGLIVAISRLQRLAYRVLLALLAVCLLPAALSTLNAPNAAHAAAVLPVVAILAAIGTSYMLELWYATFPVNSAARATGQAAIIVLVGLSLAQGYTQYFRAWSGSAETYAAYNEPANRVAAYANTDKTAAAKIIVATADETTVARYLTDGHAVTIIQPAAMTALPVNPGAYVFLVTAGARNDTVLPLSTKFPGGILRPEYSPFNQAEVFYRYEITK